MQKKAQLDNLCFRISEKKKLKTFFGLNTVSKEKKISPSHNKKFFPPRLYSGEKKRIWLWQKKILNK